MTPKEYLDRYTYLRFFSPYNLAQLQAPIRNYGSGWKGPCRYGTSRSGLQIQKEYDLFLKALRVAHHGRNDTPCGSPFYFNQRPLFCAILPTEDFYGESFAHAFNGKGSPDEITDTLRLAMAVGRIGTERDVNGQQPGAATVQTYATDFLTLDCNGFVGNFYGGDPSAEIKTYASPARRRGSIHEVKVGDAIVTHCATYPHEHVGLIAEWRPAGTTRS